MGWFDRYDDSYRYRGWGSGRDYARGGWDGGWGSRNRAYGGGSYGAGWTGGSYDRDYGTRAGYGYDYQYRQQRPEESPAYGRGGDQAVQRWARRYGYDVEHEIQPRNTGGQSGGQGVRGGYGVGGAYGTGGGYGRSGGVGGVGGGYGRGGYTGQRGGSGGQAGGYGGSGNQGVGYRGGYRRGTGYDRW